MNSVLVAEINKYKKLYYNIDARDRMTDGIVDDGVKPLVVNFWNTTIEALSIDQLTKSKFHSFLWNGIDGSDKELWEDVFINKTVKIEKEMLSGVIIHTDIMNRKAKQRSISEKSIDFRTVRQTQNVNLVRKMISNAE